jgi:hypothetical protein
MTNKEFAATNEEFKSVCTKLNIKPTKRQASKWRMKKGSAWNGKGY